MLHLDVNNVDQEVDHINIRHVGINDDFLSELGTMAKTVLTLLKDQHEAMTIITDSVRAKVIRSNTQVTKKIALKTWLNSRLLKKGSNMRIKSFSDPLFGRGLITVGEVIGVTVRGRSSLPCILPGASQASVASQPMAPRPGRKSAITLWKDIAEEEARIKNAWKSLKTSKRELEPYYKKEMEAKRQKVIERNESAEDDVSNSQSS